MKKEILICDAIANPGLKMLEKNFNISVQPGLSEAELVKVIPEYHALVVRSETKVTSRVIKAAKLLKIIARAGVGVDNIDVDAATTAGIVVVNAPRANALAAAEHTISLLLALCRNIPQADRSLRDGGWERKKFTGTGVFGKTLGIIGLGKIGSLVAERARGLGMHVIASDPLATEEQAGKLGVDLASFTELLKTADFVTLHVPLTEKTRHILSRKEFARMKRGGRIINCSRGGIVDETALLEALKKGRIAGAALDVFEKEPPINNPLLTLPNVIVTPHLGASTEEAQTGVATDIAEQIIDFFADMPPVHAVNMPSVKPEVFATHRPYFLLAEKLGRFQAALLEGSVRSIHITFNGDFAGIETPLISRYILVGFLKPTFGDYINFVNAPILTRSRGIKITESVTDKKTKFTSLITASVVTSKKETTASGTLFNGEARIVQIDEYSIDLVPEGTVIIIHHKDRPGIIGRVGTLLGSHNINIAGMQVGRKTVRGDAVMALSIDDPIGTNVLAELNKLSGLTSSRVVQF